jgi:hypothetical protein
MADCLNAFFLFSELPDNIPTAVWRCIIDDKNVNVDAGLVKHALDTLG